jgi:acetyltransferase-like isoleucine patch superfamily enzyme
MVEPPRECGPANYCRVSVHEGVLIGQGVAWRARAKVASKVRVGEGQIS